MGLFCTIKRLVIKMVMGTFTSVDVLMGKTRKKVMQVPYPPCVFLPALNQQFAC